MKEKGSWWVFSKFFIYSLSNNPPSSGDLLEWTDKGWCAISKETLVTCMPFNLESFPGEHVADIYLQCTYSRLPGETLRSMLMDHGKCFTAWVTGVLKQHQFGHNGFPWFPHLSLSTLIMSSNKTWPESVLAREDSKEHSFYSCAFL